VFYKGLFNEEIRFNKTFNRRPYINVFSYYVVFNMEVVEGNKLMQRASEKIKNGY